MVQLRARSRKAVRILCGAPSLQLGPTSPPITSAATDFQRRKQSHLDIAHLALPSQTASIKRSMRTRHELAARAPAQARAIRVEERQGSWLFTASLKRAGPVGAVTCAARHVRSRDSGGGPPTWFLIACSSAVKVSCCRVRQSRSVSDSRANSKTRELRLCWDLESRNPVYAQRATARASHQASHHRLAHPGLQPKGVQVLESMTILGQVDTPSATSGRVFGVDLHR